MANDYYNASGNPAQGSPGSSQVIRDEFADIGAGFDKLPALAGHGRGRVVVNDTGSALVVSTQSEMKVALTDQVINNSTEFTDDEALLGFTLQAGHIYRVEGILVYTAANATPDLKIMFIAPETPLRHNVRILFNDANNTNNPETVQTTEGVSSERLGLSTSGLNILWVHGAILANIANDTTWRMQWAQFQSHASDVTRKAGSYIELTRLT